MGGGLVEPVQRGAPDPLRQGLGDSAHPVSEGSADPRGGPPPRGLREKTGFPNASSRGTFPGARDPKAPRRRAAVTRGEPNPV